VKDQEADHVLALSLTKVASEVHRDIFRKAMLRLGMAAAIQVAEGDRDRGSSVLAAVRAKLQELGEPEPDEIWRQYLGAEECTE
jgi:hypothetical protein